MAQKISGQIKDLVKNSNKVLITTSCQFTGDGLASALALFLILQKMNKSAEIIINDFKIPDNFSFLPAIEQIKPLVKKLKKFIINLDISQTGIEELNYDIKGNNLRIHLSPKQGVFTPDDLKFQTSEFAYDLIFVLDTPEPESLGKLYTNHRDLFYQIPVINIDHQINNEQYGHINLVNITSASTCEILYHLVDDWEEINIDQPIATCLLTGIISKTRSFKSTAVTPEILTVAGELIKYGADRKKIVSHLYQTKTISTLKLWGKILSRLQSEPSSKIVWSNLDMHDFTESGANEKDITGVIDELITTSPLAEIVILFYQIKSNETRVIIHSQNTLNALSLARQFSPSGDKTNASFSIDENLDKAEETVLNSIKSQIIS